jgi:hypothetical protein
LELLLYAAQGVGDLVVHWRCRTLLLLLLLLLWGLLLLLLVLLGFRG